MSDPRPFWMLFAEGGSAPTYKHETQESADAEAVRLLRSNQHIRSVAVLKAEFVFMREEPPITKLAVADLAWLTPPPAPAPTPTPSPPPSPSPNGELDDELPF